MKGCEGDVCLCLFLQTILRRATNVICISVFWQLIVKSA